MANADNPARGAAYEQAVRLFFRKRGLVLQAGYQVPVGLGATKKMRKFDLGCPQPPTLIECKRHTWTGGGNSPSAKLSVWNEAMLYFSGAPPNFRKILAVLADSRAGESLAAHYVRRFDHLVPSGVEIWEVASDGEFGRLVFTGS